MDLRLVVIAAVAAAGLAACNSGGSASDAGCEQQGQVVAQECDDDQGD